MTQVVLIRPGATLYDEQDRVQGCLDIPLSERGLAEAGKLAESLRGMLLSAVYSGPSQNAIRTAETVARTLGLRVKPIEELRNLDQGLWQGLRVEEIRNRHARAFRLWLDDPFLVQPPQGEDIEEAFGRIRVALKSLIKRHRGEAIGLVACEPTAQLVASILRRENRFRVDEFLPTGGYSCINVPPEWAANCDTLAH